MAWVHTKYGDEDGSLEAAFSIVTRKGHRLVSFDIEEFQELVRISQRIDEYLNLWQKKNIPSMDNHLIVSL